MYIPFLVVVFNPTWGNDPIRSNLTNIFQMGWNHQLDCISHSFICFFFKNQVPMWWDTHRQNRPRKKKAYVRLTQDYDALDVANRIGSPAAIWLIDFCWYMITCTSTFQGVPMKPGRSRVQVYVPESSKSCYMYYGGGAIFSIWGLLGIR